MAPPPKLAILLCENSGAVVEWLMDKFNLDVSLVARVGGHSAPPRVTELIMSSGACLMNVWISARRNGDEDEDVFVFLLTGATSLYGGEIIGILTVLFRFLGYGFRLAMCSVNWMEAREFAILVPNPIAFAPWPGEPL